MLDVKWIKICTNIFEDEKIQLIESMPESDSIIVVWFKLLCLAGKKNNNGVFMFSEKIPFNDEMLSTIFRKPLNVIRLALNTFENFGMILVTDGVISIHNWEKYQNTEKIKRMAEQNRKRVSEYRDRQKLLNENNEKRFVKPTIEDINNYCVENEIFNFDAEKFINYYDSRGWKTGNTYIKDWKACIKTWVRREPSKYKKKSNGTSGLEF